MDDLHDIVQRMIDAGESEENIATVIRGYQPAEPTVAKQAGAPSRQWPGAARLTPADKQSAADTVAAAGRPLGEAAVGMMGAGLMGGALRTLGGAAATVAPTVGRILSHPAAPAVGGAIEGYLRGGPSAAINDAFIGSAYGRLGKLGEAIKVASGGGATKAAVTPAARVAGQSLKSVLPEGLIVSPEAAQQEAQLLAVIRREAQKQGLISAAGLR